MKKVVIGMLVAVLAASLVGPASAGKKKKKPKAPVPVETTFYMRRDACATDADNPHLSITDSGEDAECASSDQMLVDVYNESGLLDPSTPHAAVDGLPMAVDVARPAKGVISIRNWNGAGAGNVIVDIELLGTVGGEEMILGTFSESHLAVPAGAHTIEYEIDIDDALAGVTLDGLTLDVYVHGQTVGIAGMIEYDNPPSTISVPAFQ